MQQAGLDPKKGVRYYEYDFAKDGGAVGDITLDIESVLPPGAKAGTGMITVMANVTSGGAATIALKAVGADDIIGATAIAGFTTAARFIDITPDGTATNCIYTGANAVKGVTMTIGTAAITAGRFVLELEYTVPGE